MNPIAVPLTGGVNLLMDPRRIRDDELCYAKNLVPTKPGIVSKRGVARYAFGDTLGTGGQVPSGFAFSGLPTHDYVFTLVDPTAGNAGLQCANSSASGILTSSSLPYQNDCRPLIVTFANKTYVFPGHQPGGSFPYVGKVIQPAAGGGVEIADFNWSGTQSTNRSPRVAAPYKRRMVYGNFGPDFPTTITFSDPDDPAHVHDDFLASNGKSFFLPIGAGDYIVAMAEVAQMSVGTPMQTALLVLCKYSAFIITGEMLTTAQVPDGSSYSGNMDINAVNEPCGCVSPQTLIRTQYGVVWAGPDDVWMMNFGQTPVRIGSKIRPALERCPPNKHYLMHAEYHDGFYRLATCADGQVPDVHERMGEQWWLDLRYGAPQDWTTAMWWGPQVYLIPDTMNTAPTPGTFIMARDVRADRPKKLYAFTLALTSGGRDRHVVELDAPGAYDSGSPTSDAPILEDGNEVCVELLTREYDYAAEEQPAALFDKLWLGCDVDLWAGEQLQLSTEIVIGDQFDKQSVQVEQQGFVLGADALDSARMTRKWRGVHVPRDPDTNCIGKTYQLRLYDEPGWPVPEGKMGSYFIASDPDSAFQLLTLTPGFYPTIKEFLDELVNQFALLANGPAHNQNATPRPAVVLSFSQNCVFGYTVNSPVYIESDGARSTRAIAAKLGFTDTNLAVSPAPDTVHTATEYVRARLCAPLSIGSIVLYVDPSGRSPS